MARIRKGVAYRRLERPYTRKSKYKKLNFVRASPHMGIVRFDMGDSKKKYYYQLDLLAAKDLQIRHNSIESARLTSIRLLEATLGKTGFYLKVRVYPHHVLRENPLAAGAGADRMSTGMQKAFGKPIGVAARIYRNAPIFTLLVEKPHIETAKLAMRRAATKLPCSCILKITELAAPKKK